MAKGNDMLFVIGDPDKARQLEEAAANRDTDLHVVVFNSLVSIQAVVEQILKNLKKGCYVFLQKTFDNVESASGEPITFRHFLGLLGSLNKDEKDHLVIWRDLKENEEYHPFTTLEWEDGFRKVVFNMGDSGDVVKKAWWYAVTWITPR